MPVYTKLFLAFFFGVYFCYYLILRVLGKDVHKSTFFSNAFLLVSSLAFYACSGLVYVPLLLAVGILTYLSGLAIKRSEKHRKLLLTIFVLLELLPLILNKILGFGSIYFGLSGKSILAALGLSFFTLQAVTYTCSVYKNELEPEKSFLNVMLFVSFFPSISSGPILRAKDFIPQIKKEKKFDYEESAKGLITMGWGFVKKLVLADNLAYYISSVRGNGSEAYGLALLLTAILYSFQLYLDFSGYSDIVIGCAGTLGYDLGRNFDHPYLSGSVGEFWRRWHISLSSFLRDYVYIPLGGSRTKEWKIYRNLMVTFLASGIWHGTGITWIVWGAFHGICLCFERFFKAGKKKNPAKIILTFIVVSFGWIIFSSESLPAFAATILAFGRIPGELINTLPELISGGETFAASIKTLLMVPGSFNLPLYLFGLVIYCIISVSTEKGSGVELLRHKNTAVRWAVYFGMLLAVLFFGASNSTEFIYNRF